jgi:hypothetical protein
LSKGDTISAARSIKLVDVVLSDSPTLHFREYNFLWNFRRPTERLLDLFQICVLTLKTFKMIGKILLILLCFNKFCWVCSNWCPNPSKTFNVGHTTCGQTGQAKKWFSISGSFPGLSSLQYCIKK